MYFFAFDTIFLNLFFEIFDLTFILTFLIFFELTIFCLKGENAKFLINLIFSICFK